MKTVLLLGLTRTVVEDVRDKVRAPGVQLLVATGVEDVRSLLEQNEIDAVICGGGLPLDTRLESVREIFQRSSTTSVHMKDVTSGAEGYLPFVQRVLDSFLAPTSEAGVAP